MFKIFCQKEEKERGAVAIILTLLIMGITLLIALGLSVIFVNEIKSSGLVGRSAPAFYAADAGAEYGLYQIMKNADYSSDGEISPEIFSQESFPGLSAAVSWSTVADLSSGWINSSGSYSGTKRKVELSW